MNWKKDLTIETKFFEDSIEGIPDAILVPPNQEFIRIETGPSEDQDVRNSAEIIERLLSNKLIENFLSCWETLKQVALPMNVYRSHHRTSNSSLLSQIRKEDDRYRLRHYTDKKCDTEQIHSSNVGWLQEQRQGLYRKTKIAQTHIQRAKLLKQIVQKLKRARSQAHQVSENVVRVRSNHHLMSQIKHLQQIANRLQMQRLAPVQWQPQVVKQQQGKHHNKSKSISKEDEELEQRLWAQMQMLRQQLQGLRLQNQNILQSHLNKQDQVNHMRKEKDILIQRYQSLKHQHELLKIQSLSKAETASNSHNMQRTPASQQNHPRMQSLSSYSLQSNLQIKQQFDAQFKRKYQKQMSHLQERIRQMEQRQDQIRNQFLSELKLREELIKQNQKIHRHRQSSEKIKQKQIEDDTKRQQALKQSLEKQKQIKQQLMRQYQQQQQMLRQQIQKQQALRQQAKRQHNQRQIEIREKNLREFQQRESRLREELLKEYQIREAALQQQQRRINTIRQQSVQFVPIERLPSTQNAPQNWPQATNLTYGANKSDINRHISSQQEQSRAYGYSTTKTIKTVSQNPVIIWNETAKQEMTTKNEYKLTSKAQGDNYIHTYLEGTKKLQWPKEQQRNEFCGCCF